MPNHYRDPVIAGRMEQVLGTGLARKAAEALKRRKKKLEKELKRQGG